MMKISSLVLALLFILVLFTLPLYPRPITEIPTPYPTVGKFHWQSFPVDLYCEDIPEVEEGPRWQDIIIGSSTVEELKNYVYTTGSYSTTQYIDFISFESSISLRDRIEGLSLVEACIDPETQIVTAIRETRAEKRYLEDLIMEYGFPDEVTWGNSGISRSVFWFEKGIAALVYILEDYNPIDFGEVGLIVYFPYQVEEQAKNIWPYNRTNAENLSLEGRIYDPTPSNQQNPFESLFVTLTAVPFLQPTETPLLK